MSHIASCLNNLFTIALSQCVSHEEHGSSSTSEEYNNEEFSERKCNPHDDRVIYINRPVVDIHNMTITINMTFGESEESLDRYKGDCRHIISDNYISKCYSDTDTDTRMKFFNANSP